MASRWLLLQLLVVCCVFSGPAAAQSSMASASTTQTQPGSAASAQAVGWDVYGRNNPLGFFLALGNMDIEVSVMGRNTAEANE